MSGADRFLPERDPDRWHPPDGVPDSLRPIAMYAQPVAHGLEVVLLESEAEPFTADIQRSWLVCRSRRITPVLLVVFYPTPNGERVSLYGPTDQMVYHAIEVSRAEQLARAALDESSHHKATRLLDKELPELGTSIAGLRHVGLLNSKILTDEIPSMPEWEAAVERAVPLLMSRGSQLVEQLGYKVEWLGANTRMLTAEDRNLAVGLFSNENEPFDEPAVRLGGVSPASFALLVAKEQEVDWTLLIRTSELRLCSGKEGSNKFVEINLGLLPKDQAGYLDLMFSADALKENGTLSQILDTQIQRSEQNKEAPMMSGQTIIGCVGGETIKLRGHPEAIILTVDNKTVQLSKEATSRMVEWLISQIDDPDDPSSSSVSAPKPNAPSGPPSRRASYGIKIFDLIQAGFLEAGDLLTLTYKGRDYHAKVNSNGTLEVDGVIFPSPSSACVQVTGQASCSGWDAWKDLSGRTLAYLRRQLKKNQPQIGQPDGSKPASSKPRYKARSPRKYPGTVLGLIRGGLLEPGTVLTLTYRGKDHTAKVLADGRLEYAGQFFAKPSPACVQATGLSSCNGWTSWKTPEGHTLDELRQELRRRSENG